MAHAASSKDWVCAIGGTLVAAGVGALTPAAVGGITGLLAGGGFGAGCLFSQRNGSPTPWAGPPPGRHCFYAWRKRYNGHRHWRVRVRKCLPASYWTGPHIV